MKGKGSFFRERRERYGVALAGKPVEAGRAKRLTSRRWAFSPAAMVAAAFSGRFHKLAHVSGADRKRTAGHSEEARVLPTSPCR